MVILLIGRFEPLFDDAFESVDRVQFHDDFLVLLVLETIAYDCLKINDLLVGLNYLSLETFNATLALLELLSKLGMLHLHFAKVVLKLLDMLLYFSLLPDLLLCQLVSFDLLLGELCQDVAFCLQDPLSVEVFLFSLAELFVYGFIFPLPFGV